MANMVSSGQVPAARDGAEPYPKRSYRELLQAVEAENHRLRLQQQANRPDILTQMVTGAWRQQ